jgi:hypothetical protein
MKHLFFPSCNIQSLCRLSLAKIFSKEEKIQQKRTHGDSFKIDELFPQQQQQQQHRYFFYRLVFCFDLFFFSPAECSHSRLIYKFEFFFFFIIGGAVGLLSPCVAPYTLSLSLSPWQGHNNNNLFSLSLSPPLFFCIPGANDLPAKAISATTTTRD